MRKIIMLTVILSFALTAFAELSPLVYKEMQDTAPENLVISVTKVKKSLFSVKEANVAVDASVLKVIRSETGVTAESSICIRYQGGPLKIPFIGMPGPAPIPVLETGKKYTAYLSFADGCFVPAARGQSFEEMAKQENQ